jgi:Na+/H+-dicarboxylate symporter
MKNTNVSERLTSFRIVIGLIAGVFIGLILNYSKESIWVQFLNSNFLSPLGNIFLRSLFMIVVPLVFSSLIIGVARLGSVKRLGKMGTYLGSYYLVTSFLAVIIGQVLVTVLKPGAGLSQDLVNQVKADSAGTVATLMEKSSAVGTSLWPGILDTIIPKNIISAMADGNMLAIIFVAILFGIALLAIGNQKAKPLVDLMESVSESSIIIVGWIMRIAPFAVAALMATAVSRFGLEILSSLAKYVGVVVLGYLIHILMTYQLIIRFVLKYPFKLFLRKMIPIFATAFSTSSSSATMPTTIRTCEKSFGVKEEIAAFSIPLGATVNMDGTALFECIAALFIAQVFGIEIGLSGQISLVFLVVLTSIGVAGVPGGSIPILMSAMAMLGIPPEGIALILGVDRLLDMGRTVVNVTGDAVGALILNHLEGHELNRTMDEKIQI